jgi:hypothetical protein
MEAENNSPSTDITHVQLRTPTRCLRHIKGRISPSPPSECESQAWASLDLPQATTHPEHTPR